MPVNMVYFLLARFRGYSMCQRCKPLNHGTRENATINAYSCPLRRYNHLFYGDIVLLADRDAGCNHEHHHCQQHNCQVARPGPR